MSFLARAALAVLRVAARWVDATDHRHASYYAEMRPTLKEKRR